MSASHAGQYYLSHIISHTASSAGPQIIEHLLIHTCIEFVWVSLDFILPDFNYAIPDPLELCVLVCVVVMGWGADRNNFSDIRSWLTITPRSVWGPTRHFLLSPPSLSVAPTARRR